MMLKFYYTEHLSTMRVDLEHNRLLNSDFVNAFAASSHKFMHSIVIFGEMVCRLTQVSSYGYCLSFVPSSTKLLYFYKMSFDKSL